MAFKLLKFLPVVVDSGLPTNGGANTLRRPVSRQPLRRVIADSAMLNDPDQHVLFLQQLEREVYQGTEQARTHPMAGVLTVKRVSFPTVGFKTFITHGFGSAVSWLVVGWRGVGGAAAGAGASIEESQVAGDQTNDRLSLIGYVIGEADLMVWPKP